MRKAMLVAAVLLVGCEVSVNGSGGAQDPSTANTAPPATAAPPVTAAPPATAAPVAGGNHRVASRVRLRNGSVPVVSGTGVFGGAQTAADDLQGLIYFLPENTPRLPDYATLQPQGVLYTRQLAITPRSFTAGFPGVNNRFEWFGIRYTGHFNVAQAGSYNFHVQSDDGSKVWIDNALLIDNDGVHPPQDKTATISLGAGQHTIQVDYFQGPRDQIALQLWVTPPGRPEMLWSPSF